MDIEMSKQLVALAQIAHRLLARIEADEVLITSLIATHPDPASVRAEWHRVTSQASASMLLESASSGRPSAYRDQSEKSFADWSQILDNLCEQADD